MTIFVLLFPLDASSAEPRRPVRPPVKSDPSLESADSLGETSPGPAAVVPFQAQNFEENFEENFGENEALPQATPATDSIPRQDDEWEVRTTEFNPDPTRAVWLAALFPGLGQIYNRSYWKLPIVVGGFMGLGYATSWNNNMLKDYTRAYADITDSDASTNSYMDFFPSTTKESDLDKTWLTNLLKTRKDYFRRNRDLCIICMVGVYLIAMVDAYVDASLSHFDISPDLSLDISPTLIQDTRDTLPSLCIQWAFNF